MTSSQERIKTLKALAQLLKQREHTPLELKEKLLRRFSEDSVEEALREAQNQKWIKSNEELSEQVVTQLNRKNKSWFYMKHYLEKKGLDPSPYDRQTELEKMENLLKKSSFKKGMGKNQVYLFFKRKGFDDEALADFFLEWEDGEIGKNHEQF